MSSNYPNFHTHAQLRPGPKGQKGVGGDKGRPGQDGRVTEIVFAFEDRPPEDLNGPIIGKDWAKPGSPVHFLEVRPYQSVVYMPNNSIWTYLPAINAKGWQLTGYVNADLYNVPGDKGDPGDAGSHGSKGDVGDKGDRGEKGHRGLPGLVAKKGDTGDTGQKGDTGEKGVRGVHGIRGVDGQKGETGDKGEPGLLGLKGDRGVDGANGVDGSQGPKGLDGIVPGIEAVPVMMASYDGVNNILGAKHNISSVTRVSAGLYRFRLDSKTRGGNKALTMVTLSVSDENDNIPNLIAVVGRQTDRVVTVAVRDLDQGILADAHVNVVMFNPSPEL